MQLGLFDVSDTANIPSADFDGEALLEGESLFDGHFILYRRFLSNEQATEFFESLLKDIDWQNESISMYGKMLECPRLTYWMGDASSHYTYSKIEHHPNAWHSDVIKIKQHIESRIKAVFNSCLLNLYRHQSDSVSWHQDNERELGANPLIASVSLGESRTFEIKHKKSKKKYQIPLHHGDLLIMKGESQRSWYHQLPKEKYTCNKRINLTFRKIN